MDWVTFLGSTSTVVSFLLFAGIVVWAYSSARRAAFTAAANAPFALPDEVAGKSDLERDLDGVKG